MHLASLYWIEVQFNKCIRYDSFVIGAKSRRFDNPQFGFDINLQDSLQFFVCFCWRIHTDYRTAKILHFSKHTLMNSHVIKCWHIFENVNIISWNICVNLFYNLCIVRFCFRCVAKFKYSRQSKWISFQIRMFRCHRYRLHLEFFAPLKFP